MSFRSSLETSKFSKQMQISREQYPMIAAFSAFWTGSAYKTTILESEAASAKTTRAALTLLIC